MKYRNTSKQTLKANKRARAQIMCKSLCYVSVRGRVPNIARAPLAGGDKQHWDHHKLKGFLNIHWYKMAHYTFSVQEAKTEAEKRAFEFIVIIMNYFLYKILRKYLSIDSIEM